LVEQEKEQEKLQAEAGKEEAEHVERMGLLIVAADREKGMLRLSTMMDAGRARVALDTQLENAAYQVKIEANAKEIQALYKGGKDYQNKLLALNNKELELTKEHENKVTQIRVQAEIERDERLKSARERLEDAEAKGLTDVLTRQESFAKMMKKLGAQVADGMMENAMKTILANNMTKLSDAKYAARQGWKAGTHFPFPTNLVMEPLLAASGFAAVMAFDEGGIVGGTGGRDTVSARLTPGEGVIPKQLMEGLTNAAKHGSGDNNPAIHIHHHPTYHVQALDSAGVERVLEKHSDAFAQHAANHIRKMNR